jgi:hypothetical protein
MSRGGGSDAIVPVAPAALDARSPSSLTGIRMMLGRESGGLPRGDPAGATVAGPAATTAAAGTASGDPVAAGLPDAPR